MNTVLVIGATGNVGRHVVSQLQANGGAHVRAVVRPGQRTHGLDGVDVVTGNLDDPVRRSPRRRLSSTRATSPPRLRSRWSTRRTSVRRIGSPDLQ